jgi:hypothetical protein
MPCVLDAASFVAYFVAYEINKTFIAKLNWFF